MNRPYLHIVQAKLTRVTSGGRYIAEIDGLRFLAIMPVILHHLSERMIKYYPQEVSGTYEGQFFPYLVSRGSIGVLLFFAISGFILALPFANYYAGAGKEISLKKYYRRRLTRLEPPYILWMTLFACILLIRGVYTGETLIGHYLSSIFYVHYFVYQEFSIINPVAWSLEIEIQFYLLAPLLAKLVFKYLPERRRAVLLAAVIIGWIVCMQLAGWNKTPLKFTLLGQLPYFLTGYWVANWYLFHKKNPSSKQLIWDLLGVSAFISMLFSWSEEGILTVVFVAALAILMLAAFNGKLLPAVLRYPWISIIGGMCYTIYLTHLPLLELLFQFSSQLAFQGPYWLHLIMQVGVCLPVLLLLSAIFFLYTEKPFMKKDAFRRLWKNTTLVELVTRE